MDIYPDAYNFAEEERYEETDDLENVLQMDSEIDKVVSKNGLKWNKQLTSDLISCVKEKYNLFDYKLKKDVWNLISNDLEKITKINVTPQQCDTKFKLLKAKYKQIKIHNNSTGREPKNWEFYSQLDEILNNRPEICAVVTANSDSRALSFSSSSSTSINNDSEDGFNNGALPRTSKKRISDVERRHQENLQRQDKFLSLMEQLIENRR